MDIDTTHKAEPASLAGTTMVLSDISKRYDAVAALTDVSFDVRPGEIHALLGENGAGKSTLMGVASGTIQPDSGHITFGDDELIALSPAEANRLGIAIVHQHPALLPDLTVAENIRLGVPADRLRAASSEDAAMRAMLDEVNLNVHLNDRTGGLTIAQKHLLEVAKALAVAPKLLILDEPTAPLGKDSVDLLFDHVRAAAARGTAVVYITHRLAEVRLLADRVTVLRDGILAGSADVESISDDQLLAWIVGRSLESTFPAKPEIAAEAPVSLQLDALSGEGFSDISVELRRGEILGVAGVVGNGQSELLAALAGLGDIDGPVHVKGEPFGSKSLRKYAAYMPADRHREGLMMSLSVRENAAVSALGRFKGPGGFLKRSTESGIVRNELESLAVRAPSMEANVTELSGGNQQKVVMSRALLSEPRMLIADEPTQGVDVGARAEIYRILREVTESGIPVVVASSDAAELEGLCDRVIVLSRGHIVAQLDGADITEERMIHAAISATTQRTERPKDAAKPVTRLRRLLQSDHAPSLFLLGVIAVLALYIASGNDRYFSEFNINSMLLLVAALGFIAIGQTVVLMVAGIDLAVGPLAGFLVVVGSFFVNNEQTVFTMALGFAAMLVCALIAGATNGLLIRYGKFTAVAATLTVYIALQGLSFVLRSSPGGLINSSVTKAITTKFGPIPLVFIVLVVASVLMEHALRNRPWGLQLRALGSSEDAARQLGVNTNRVAIGAYIMAGFFTFLGAIVLMAQIGIGDPAQGIGYTLSSITAAVLGGTSLLGGRGSFIGTLFGSVLMIQVLNATVFLGLDQKWQFFFQGALVMAAALVYSQVRGSREFVRV